MCCQADRVCSLLRFRTRSALRLRREVTRSVSAAMAALLAQRHQPSLFWIALSLPVLKLPLHAATLEPLCTVITCPARSSTSFVFLSRVDLCDSANQTWSGLNQPGSECCSSGDAQRRSNTGQPGCS
jgi:hypothetical protein